MKKAEEVVGTDRLLKMNLQLFAEGEEGSTDSGSEGGSGDSGTGEPTDTTKAFSARLNQEKSKIEKQYGPYKAVLERQAKNANMSLDEYVAYAANKQEEDALNAEAEKTGKTPEVLKAEKAKTEAEERLAQYELKEKLTAEEKTLIADPKIGSFVSDNIQQIREIAESTGTSLQTGLALVAAEKLPELIAAADPQVHIKKYLADLKSGQKPVEIGGSASGSPRPKETKNFDDAKASAIERLNNTK